MSPTRSGSQSIHLPDDPSLPGFESSRTGAATGVASAAAGVGVISGAALIVGVGSGASGSCSRFPVSLTPDGASDGVGSNVIQPITGEIDLDPGMGVLSTENVARLRGIVITGCQTRHNP